LRTPQWKVNYSNKARKIENPSKKLSKIALFFRGLSKIFIKRRKKPCPKRGNRTKYLERRST